MKPSIRKGVKLYLAKQGQTSTDTDAWEFLESEPYISDCIISQLASDMDWDASFYPLNNPEDVCEYIEELAKEQEEAREEIEAAKGSSDFRGDEEDDRVGTEEGESP